MIKIKMYFRLQGGVWVDPTNPQDQPYADQIAVAAFVKQALIDTYMKSDDVNSSQVVEDKTYEIEVHIRYGEVTKVI